MMKQKKNQAIELFGWYGMLAILSAYGALSFSLLKSNSLLYQVLNLTGALGLLIDTYYKKDYQPAVLNIIWSIIAAISIITLIF